MTAIVEHHDGAARQRAVSKSAPRIPDFEIPTSSKNSIRGKGYPYRPVKGELPPSDDTQPQAWTGTQDDGALLGLDFDRNRVLTGGFLFIPPDSHAAAGPDHLVAVTNVAIAFYDKDTGALVGDSTLQNFFSPLGANAPDTFTFDPKVLYDQFEDRFVVITLEATQIAGEDDADTSLMFVAVSQTSDPTGAWNMMVFNSESGAGTAWADYPGFAVDEDAVYITANHFTYAESDYESTALWIIDKGVGTTDGLYGNGVNPVSTVLQIDVGGGPTLQPTHIYGDRTSTNGTFLVGYSGYSSGGISFIQVGKVSNPVSGSPTITWQDVNIGDIDFLGFSLPNGDQSGTTTDIASNDRRALDAVWRNGSVYLTMTILSESAQNAGDATAYWVRLNAPDVASPFLTYGDGGEIGGEDLGANTTTTFASVAVDAFNNMVVGFSATNGSMFPGAYFVTREPGDAPGTTGASQLVKAGEDYYIRNFGGSSNRWGDYSSASMDTGEGCFWVFNEYAQTRGTPVGGDGRWGTAFVQTCACRQAAPGLPADQWVAVGASCLATPGDTVADVFAEADPDDYLSTWGLVEWDAQTESYAYMDLADPLVPGRGYWALSLGTGFDLRSSGSFHTMDDIPVEGASGGLRNFMGNIRHTPVAWADMQVVDGSDVLSLDEADPLDTGPDPDIYECSKNSPGPGCVLNHKMFKWNGAGYDPFDGVTPGMEGVVGPFEGFWIEAHKPGIALRYPAAAVVAPAAGSVPTALAPGAAGVLRVKERPVPLDEATAEAKFRQDWYLRLIVSSGDLEDAGNVFGHLAGAKDGQDRHDITTIAPFGDRWLDAVFDNPLLEPAAWGYASDYRRPKRRPRGVWPVVVKTSPDIGTVSLRLEGPRWIQRQTWVRNPATGEIFRLRPGRSYSFEPDPSGETPLVLSVRCNPNRRSCTL